ncbi:hypothetical protein GC209_10295 [bacterium]|nr:hypothetical protein [bacterium]
MAEDGARREVDLTPDCQACAALCCVLLPFDAGDAFAFDKPAAVACRHLDGHACRIHADLATRGFAGCQRYNCHGAGQRVTQEVFAGRSWRTEPGLLAAMDRAFRAMRRLHEDHGLLTAARTLPLTDAEEAERLALLARLDAATSQTEASLIAYDTGPLPRAVKAFLEALRLRLRSRQ